jgi:serpin B
MQILELPYAGDDLSMIIVLPRKIDGLARLEASLSVENLDTWLGQLNKQKVKVLMPRFKITSQFSLERTLDSMGMPDAFDSNRADFSGIDGTKMLYISAIVHKAFVEVNEEGTEAAAATGVIIGLKSVPLAPPVFRADHPFLFAIRDNHTGSILFLGRVINPTK